MTARLVDQLLYLMDDAFDGPDWHSLLRNLESVREEDWGWVAPGGQRSIRDIAEHIGVCKLMYHNQAFGDGQLTWDELGVQGHDAAATMPSAIAWLRECHGRLRQGIAVLDDDELLRPRRHHSRGLRETRWIITVMTQHDLYHAGEINYIRALRQGDDEL